MKRGSMLSRTVFEFGSSSAASTGVTVTATTSEAASDTT